MKRFTMRMTMSIRVLLVDDHEVVREGLRSLIAQQSDMEVVGEAGTAQDAIDLAEVHQPDVVVLDVGMPDMNGVAITERLHNEHPNMRVLALSIHDDKRFVTGMLGAGATGYLTKDCALNELARAIRVVTAGKTYLAPTLAASVIETYQGQHEGTAGDKPKLSPRERDVVQLIAEGLTTKQIAERLFLSTRTVETHRRNIMEKLELRGVAELTRYAIREGLAPLD
jgi:DNA-binding NarL/FixJ family response regulator